MMIPTDCHKQLTEMHQEHVLEHWDALSENQKEKLSSQIQSLDFETIKALQKALKQQKKEPPAYFPLKKAQKTGSAENAERGAKILSEGRAGCLILAGGMGTRLNVDGPKGIFPVTLSKKSLFQFFSERIKAASKLYGQSLPVAIMTSPLNDRETRDFFEKHNNFGLEKDQIDFFVQQDLPLLDKSGNLFLDAEWHIAEGPNGNGECLKEFYRSGIWRKWKERGIEYVNLALIDNPLADPFDAELIGAHDRLGCDILVKTVKRVDPDEKVGVLVQVGDKIHVLEYSEINQKDKENIEDFPYANLSLFSVTMSFIEKAKDLKLPLHKAYKAAPFLSRKGETIKPASPNAWKFETFIFDTFLHGRVEVIAYPREECFAPLKNKTGESSPETVLASLQDYDRKIYEKISGLKAPERPFELDPAFYYPPAKLLEKWKKRLLPNERYISPS